MDDLSVHVVIRAGAVIGHDSGWNADGCAGPEEAEQVLTDAPRIAHFTGSRTGDCGEVVAAGGH
ncbi:MAG: hypothetical protein EON55_21355 [Alphaproteobacteria bacterium]|nr:MAG: hypothetical protein EON55_21355 [Alphaproteobacteria bacterium]